MGIVCLYIYQYLLYLRFFIAEATGALAQASVTASCFPRGIGGVSPMEVPGKSPICGQNLVKNSINGLEFPSLYHGTRWKNISETMGNHENIPNQWRFFWLAGIRKTVDFPASPRAESYGRMEV